MNSGILRIGWERSWSWSRSRSGSGSGSWSWSRSGSGSRSGSVAVVVAVAVAVAVAVGVAVVVGVGVAVGVAVVVGVGVVVAMSMSNGGLTKLIEECGELIQVAAKKIAYPNTPFHPDSLSVQLDVRLEDEMADVLAAIYFVRDKMGLSDHDIRTRIIHKTELYQKWDKE